MKNFGWIFLGFLLIVFSCTSSDADSDEPEQIEENQEEEVITVPVVSTTQITEITNNTATGGGTNINDGGSNITQKGICWSKVSSPDLDDNFTEEGGSTEDFTSFLDELDGNTTYFVRAYAINEIGVGYGEELSFTTDENPVVVYEGDVELTSQAEVDEFGMNGYTIVTGSFAVVANLINQVNPEYISNLDGIKQLTEVGTDLSILSTTVENLDALSNLKKVGGSINIQGNPLLAEIDFLNEITEINSDVVISSNPSVIEISGFKNVVSINGDLELISMDGLETISGFGQLNSISGLLRFQSLISVMDFSGFTSLSSIGGDLDILTSSISDMNGFSSLTNIGGSLILRTNVILDNVDGLSNLSTIQGDLIVDNNASALNDNFTDGLKNVNGFINLNTLGGDLTVTSNKLLTDFCGLKTIFENGYTGNYTVGSSNGYNPSKEQILGDECSN
ncbi:MAG: hypothetical protein CBB72_018950 [Muricauda sp. TMED12]|nr:MAG: hypothetical protein CBB72_018950 [Muricauda sp. TMED12]|tara:strand:+ start:156507 stop:157856 length:1350 start_codon:yes stop_codon:yes gene_type:complete